MTRIVCASARPDLIPTVGRWHWAEWGRHDPGGSLDAWTRDLAASCHADRVPATWIALENDEPVGSASLVEYDMSTRRDLRPWLAGVFVVPERRGRGIGAALVRRAMAEAARFGVERLYLHTNGSEGFYRSLGWSAVGTESYQGRQVTIMEHSQADSRSRGSFLVLKTGATHEEIARAEGDFEDWFLRALGPAADAAVADARTEELPAPGSPGGVIVTGSPDMVTDRADWMERAAAWLRERVEAGRPVLGVCFGHQLLAWALGGIVDDNPGGRECGTVEVEQTEAGRADPLLGEMPMRFDAFSVHRQSVRRLPPGAELLASSPRIEVQAARYGERAWGVQFHPEFTESVVRAYVRQYGTGLVDDGIDPDAVLAAVRPSRADRLLRRFHDLCQEREGA